MKTRRDQVTKYGIVALAGIAILGWVREPEKHNFQAVPRVVFSPPPDDSNPVVSDIGEKPTPSHESEKAASRPARAVHRIVSATSQPAAAVGATPVEPASVHSPATHTSSGVSKPEKADRQTSTNEHMESRDDGDRTASRGPETQQRNENLPEVNRGRPTTERAEGTSQRSDPTLDHPASQTPVTVGSKTRSTARSAAIIAGIAAAGAAIGGAAGGGKGAAIGAMTGGAGGFVYDRMTRRKDLAYAPDAPNHRSGYGSVSNDYVPNYEKLSMFRTPSFNGR